MKWEVKLSTIHGNGVFAKADIAPQEDIGVSIVRVFDSVSKRIFERNTFGLLINNNPKSPNAETIMIGNNWHFVALSPINKGEEILVDYNDYMAKINAESAKLNKRVIVV